jgi:succinate dehydrogenase/fumarate reductase cytochrome b subunit
MKKSFIIAGVSLTSFFILSSFVSAQSASVTSVNQGIGTFASLITNFTQSIVKATGTLFMALAMVAFFYGIVQYIWGARESKPEKIKTGNEFIKWSLVALFVMFSVYGIIRFFQVFICNGPCSETIIIPDINFGKSNPGQVNTGTPLGGSVPGQVNTGTPLGGGSTDCANISSESQRDACFAEQRGSVPGQVNTGTPLGGGSTDCANISSESQRDACFAEQRGPGE